MIPASTLEPSPQGASRPHKHTKKCGFDRNSSHTEDRYVCECGWRDIHPQRRSKPAKKFNYAGQNLLENSDGYILEMENDEIY